MFQHTGRFVRVSELTSENDRDLFNLIIENLSDYRELISEQPIPARYSEFIETLRLWFLHGRVYQLLSYRKNSGALIGTVFFYAYNEKCESVKLSVFIQEGSRRSCAAAETILLALSFAREILRVKKVLISVFPENKHMHDLMRKLGIQPTPFEANSKKKRPTVDYEIVRSVLDRAASKLSRLR